MKGKLTFILNRLREQLWFRPVLFCLFSVAGALVAHLSDNTELYKYVPKIKTESIQELLSTLSASMLVISIFAVGSMISAYNAASNTATPRSFKLVVADDSSQNALSVFIGSFIFSVVATVAMKNGYYGKSGHFTLFALTVGMFTIVIFTFLNWVSKISSLGRLATTIQKIEDAAAKSIRVIHSNHYLGSIPYDKQDTTGVPLYIETIGHILQINTSKLQQIAEEKHIYIRLNCLQGNFITPNKPILYITTEGGVAVDFEMKVLEEAFTLGPVRLFDEDPRFGFITLSEIASRALSPAVNDPGTAIAILESHLRLFAEWIKNESETKAVEPLFSRIKVPVIHVEDLFEDAFRPIARDGAGNIEVQLRLQKVLQSIYSMGDERCKELAKKHSILAYKRAEGALPIKEESEMLKSVSILN
ncbi:DUF2254 domain-containing protein [uncultured Cytophaga sp.]|uniref:DUF2254 domain-containing protein n=1 Tax=uncultured Cytophaga sp. TaxID=160238 RepID=UPI0026265DBA|nr:DUF2254 domain-containing protein [uncultured Cytophaga sp.]